MIMENDNDAPSGRGLKISYQSDRGGPVVAIKPNSAPGNIALILQGTSDEARVRIELGDLNLSVDATISASDYAAIMQALREADHGN